MGLRNGHKRAGALDLESTVVLNRESPGQDQSCIHTWKNRAAAEPLWQSAVVLPKPHQGTFSIAHFPLGFPHNFLLCSYAEGKPVPCYHPQDQTSAMCHYHEWAHVQRASTGCAVSTAFHVCSWFTSCKPLRDRSCYSSPSHGRPSELACKQMPQECSPVLCFCQVTSSHGICLNIIHILVSLHEALPDS